ncbi:MAG TPA: xanthine dehydrogenase family protein molybdopterin-binding subunit [Chloroflexota bacterium]
MSATSRPAQFSGLLDGVERVTGRVAYTINLELPGMLHARLLRSPAPHARIARLDVSAARQVPGVALVLTGEDVRGRAGVSPYFGPVFRDQPVLAIDRVRFSGEPVAAVVAEDPDSAQQAIDLIDVDYEVLPAVFDPLEALAPGAPLVHQAPPRQGATFADLVIHTDGATNICNHFKLRKGDVERGFAESDVVFEDTFSSPAVQHVPLETHACVAQVEEGKLTVWATTQTPHVVRAQLAEMFGLPLAAVRVIVPTLGGAYGSKCYPKIEPLTAVLAAWCRRPVRLHLSRAEEFVTITKHAVVITMKTGLTHDGRIVARKSTCYFNTGAYADIGPRLIKNGGYATAGPHAIPNVWVDSYAVYTNVPPAGAYRGYGVSQAAWAYDTQLDMIADRMGLDPLQIRLRNLLRDGDTFATGEPVQDCHYGELLSRAAEAIGWQADESPRRIANKVRAKGLSCIIKSTVTPSTSTASVKLNEDGSLNVLTSSVEMGQGLKTALAVLAAEKLGIDIHQVHVSDVDTDVTPYDQQTSASRSTYAMGSAVMAAMDDVREQLRDVAAHEFEVAAEDIELEDGRARVVGSPGRSASYAELIARGRRGNILGQGTYASSGGLDPETGQGIGSVHWHQGAGSAEVEVDLETGRIDVLRYHGAAYAGRVINPVLAELQTEGSIAFGVGHALFEELVYDGGQLQNGNLADYMIAGFKDLPEVSVSVVEHLEAHDIHGLGETSLPPVMPAVGNAVFRATGVRIQDLPITPEKILRGLRELRQRQAPGEPGEASA